MPKKAKGKKKGTKVPLYRGVKTIPREMIITNRFNKYGVVLSAGNTFGNIRFEPTYAYDVDPTLASTAMPFFSELTAMYRVYRVEAFTYDITVSNNETAQAALAYVCPVNFDPGVNTASFQNYLSNSYSRKSILGPSTGNSRGRFRGTVTQAQFVGLEEHRVEDTTTGASTTAPSNNIWIMLGFGVTTGVQAAGLSYTADLNITIRFFERASPPT